MATVNETVTKIRTEAGHVHAMKSYYRGFYWTECGKRVGVMTVARDGHGVDEPVTCDVCAKRIGER